MFRRSFNRALLRVRVTTVTPLLIRAGDTGLSPAAADLSCVRTHHGVYGKTVYVPGSSLKGVLRQAAEASVRGRKYHGGTVNGACDPLDDHGSCWGAVKDKRGIMTGPEIFGSLCLACRTFGSLAAKGRTSVRDLFPWDDSSAESLASTEENRANANRVEVRHGVAINRITGSAQRGALFDQEVVPTGVEFWGEIALENFQIWQLGLLVQALEELDAGFARIGSSTTRGLGEVRTTIESILHEQASTGSKRPMGVGAFANDGERKEYHIFSEEPLDVDDAASTRGLFDRFTIANAARVSAWRDRALERLSGLR